MQSQFFEKIEHRKFQSGAGGRSYHISCVPSEKTPNSFLLVELINHDGSRFVGIVSLIGLNHDDGPIDGGSECPGAEPRTKT